MMNSKPSSTGLSRRLNKLVLFVAGLSFLGFADSTYLTAEHYFALPLPCSLTQGCDVVLRSAYAMVGPAPTSFFGVLYYLALLFLAVQLYTSQTLSVRLMKTLFGLTSLGLVISGFLSYLQVFVIRALCMYCLASAGIAFLLFIATFFLWKTLTRS